ncbi:hypothetical protein PENTCL1PPCAC_14401, partial [Pristionchus entomophagus]
IHKVYRDWAERKYGGKVLLVQDNAQCHVSDSTRSYLEKENIEILDWCSESPDLNPVEMVWALLKQWLQTNNNKGTTLQELEDKIREWWSTKMNKALCRNLILRMQSQMKKVVEAQGAPVYD